MEDRIKYFLCLLQAKVMGLEAVDSWTLGHFIMGVIATMAICPYHPSIGLLLANIGHAWMEANELDYRKGVHVESTKNHHGDIIAFFLGSLLGIFLTPITIKYPFIRWILLAVLAVSVTQEVGREVWPETWPFDPANDPWGWFGTVKALVDDKKK